MLDVQVMIFSSNRHPMHPSLTNGVRLFFGLWAASAACGQTASVTDLTSTFYGMKLPSQAAMTDPFADQHAGE